MKIPAKLTEQLAQGGVVPFVGSGVSLGVQVNGESLFPSWGELLLDMAAALDAAGKPDEAEIVRLQCKRRRWFKAAEEALDGLNKTGFYEVLRRRFDISPPADADWSLPDAIWRLQPSIVVTTNYEDVLAWRKLDSRRLLNDQPEELAELSLREETVSIELPFQLATYPVTNAQFARFFKAGGYDETKWWQEAGWRWREKNKVVEPSYWRDTKWNGATQPVVGVSWWEADAFCRWAGCRLATEREWEAAARGPQGWAYPWGNDWQEEICNSAEANLGATTPVGIFPQSVAVCGAHDMAGNVWEWCSDTFDPDRKDDPEAGRVLRGGSWSGDRRNCRSAVRNVGRPVGRNYNVGFRVART